MEKKKTETRKPLNEEVISKIYGGKSNTDSGVCRFCLQPYYNGFDKHMTQECPANGN